MLTLDRLRVLINDPAMSDAELERVRDDLRTLAEIVLAQWRAEQDREPGEAGADYAMIDAPSHASHR